MSSQSHSYADTVECLFAEFEGRVPLPLVSAVVHECREQLSCSPETAIPELLARLARQRLKDVPQPVPTLGGDHGSVVSIWRVLPAVRCRSCWSDWRASD